MKLSGTSRMAAGFAAATITAALAMPGIASANPHHNPNPHNPHGDKHSGEEAVVEAPELCTFLDEAGNRHHGKHWGGHKGPSFHGAQICEEEAPAVVEEAPAAPAKSYPVQAKTGSVAPTEYSETGLVIVTLAAAAALGGVAVRRATR